jgi:hypothetical protein
MSAASSPEGARVLSSTTRLRHLAHLGEVVESGGSPHGTARSCASFDVPVFRLSRPPFPEQQLKRKPDRALVLNRDPQHIVRDYSLPE